jgi:predicted ArsR family transcriptional regulator
MSRNGWTFLSNHAHVFIQIAVHPTIKLSELASSVGITLRSVQGIIADLEAAGYVQVTKSGRQNVYTVNPHANFRHPLESDKEVAALVEMFRRGAELPSA